MSDDSALSDLLVRLDRGELGDPLPALAYLAGRAVEVEEAELNAALRRSLLLLATGGDPRRGLELDDPAVKSLAADLARDERLATLVGRLDELVLLTRELPLVRRGLLFLAADIDLAWRLYALGLLAEELDDLNEGHTSE